MSVPITPHAPPAPPPGTPAPAPPAGSAPNPWPDDTYRGWSGL